MEWCGGVVMESGTDATVYFHTYHPEYGINNRLDFKIGEGPIPLFPPYIAKMENGGFICFDSLHIHSALEESE
jgi:hypothetical protein